MSGPLAGLRGLELAGERSAFAGRLLAGLGAEVLLIEPPGGDRMRTYEPFLDDEPGPERSLFAWHYNAGKRGITLNLESERGREILRQLAAGADFMLESEPPGRLAGLGLDYPDLQPLNPKLVMISVTPFGRSGPRAAEAATDLTILAAGGPAWMCGYDDHTLPPVRGGGNQGYQTGSHFAVMSALAALLHRNSTGRGQHIDVNMHAAANVTTEAGSYTWLVSQEITQRQAGRHAATTPTMPTTVRCADGRLVNTTVPPRNPSQFRACYEWLAALGVAEGFEGLAVLRSGFEGERVDVFLAGEDPDIRAKMVAGRRALELIASQMPAYEFFTGAQERGFQVAIIYSPEEAFEDPQFVARGFQVEVDHPELGRSFRYPGAPIRFTASPWQGGTRAPLLGEHNTEVLGGLGIDEAGLRKLRDEGVV
jgi:crotonobetainyl-CoA:carnitine CoA-transferase CaiB-like acyl-CoA transferase